MVKWHCDICGKAGSVNPRSKPMTKEVEKTVIEPTQVFGETKKRTIKQQIPLTTVIRRQNNQTGKLERHEIPLMEDLENRAIIVSLNAGMENIQKDFCKECFEEEIKPKIDDFFSFLDSYESR